MRIIALDLSKSSTGWSMWKEGDEKPLYGSWELGIPMTPDGRTYARLHQKLSDMNSVGAITHLFFEDPLHPAKLQGHTNIDSIRVLGGLAAHAESWAEAMSCRVVRRVNMTTWRRHFIGSQKRGTKSKALKAYVMERCAQFGLEPKNDDEADSLGILTYAINNLGFVPPWEKNMILRPELVSG